MDVESGGDAGTGGHAADAAEQAVGSLSGLAAPKATRWPREDRASKAIEDGVLAQCVVVTDEPRVWSDGDTREAIVGPGLDCCEELS